MSATTSSFKKKRERKSVTYTFKFNLIYRSTRTLVPGLWPLGPRQLKHTQRCFTCAQMTEPRTPNPTAARRRPSTRRAYPEPTLGWPIRTRRRARFPNERIRLLVRTQPAQPKESANRSGTAKKLKHAYY